MPSRATHLIGAAVVGVAIGAIATSALMSRAQARSEWAAPTFEPRTVAARAIDGPPSREREPAASSGDAAPSPIDPSVPSLTAGDSGLVDELRARRLAIPVQGIDASQLVHSFEDTRSGARRHEAIDILAPRNTPVVAVEDGTIARLFTSKAGGITLYQYDPREKFVYYYAHLESYAPGLVEGGALKRGQVIGYVGTSGNAPPNTPHLHFAIYELTQRKKWWEGNPIDPFSVLR